jgi:hypothetical protein
MNRAKILNSVKVHGHATRCKNRRPRNHAVEKYRTGVVVFDHLINFDLKRRNRSVKEAVTSVISELVIRRVQLDCVPESNVRTTGRVGIVILKRHSLFAADNRFSSTRRNSFLREGSFWFLAND